MHMKESKILSALKLEALLLGARCGLIKVYPENPM